MTEQEDRQKITLYIPKPLNREFRILAAQLGESMSELFREALTERIPEFRHRVEVLESESRVSANGN